MNDTVQETAMTPLGYVFMITAWTIVLALAGYCFKRILTDNDDE